MARFLFSRCSRFTWQRVCKLSVLIGFDVVCVSVDMYIQILHINMDYNIIIFVKVDKDFNILKWLLMIIFFLLGVLCVLCI